MDNGLDQLMKSLEKIIQRYFDNKISIHKDGFGLYRLVSAYISDAKDLYKNSFSDTKVVSWFDDYWLKLSLSFGKIESENYKTSVKSINKADYFSRLEKTNLKVEDTYYEAVISLSVFKGDFNFDSKLQLFRAEWDNYATQQNSHPQPHWQFYQISEYQSLLAELTGDRSFSETVQEDGFGTFLLNSIDLKKFHFAMNGNWINNETHIHPLNSSIKLLSWFEGLFPYLKIQLEYLS